MCMCDTIDDSISVTRSVELDVPPKEAWGLIGDGERWADWMVDEASIDVSPGETGEVIDAGERREVRVGRVESGESIAFEWWPAQRRDLASVVELTVVPARSGAVLEIVESFPSRGAISASAIASAWQPRLRRVSALRRLLVAA